jgi:Fe-S-cluster containining protein
MSGICDTCHAGCCRTYHLVITAFDALSIANDLSLPVGEFATFLATSGEVTKLLSGHNTPIQFTDPELRDKQYFVALKKVESQLIPGTQKCHFLLEWNRQETIPGRGDHPGARIAGRCGIYHSRPQMCRAFPAFLHSNGAVAFVSTPAPNDLQLQHEIYKVCPEKWTPEAFTKDPSEALHTLVVTRYERDFQNLAVEEWNKNPGAAKDFFPFMQKIYGTRFRMSPEMVATPPEIKNADGTTFVPAGAPAPAADSPPPAQFS